MIDAEKAPRAHRAYKKMEKDGLLDKNMRELLAELAVAEEHAKKTAARLGVYDTLVTQLEQLSPPQVDREMMTPVDMRHRLKLIAHFLGHARETLQNLI